MDMLRRQALPGAIAFSHKPARPAKRRCGPIFALVGLMRYIFLTTAGMINAERFAILPTHRTNFKRGPDTTAC